MGTLKLLILLRSCTATRSLKEGKIIHQKIITQGLQGHIPLCKSLMNLYFSCHSFKHAKLVFNAIVQPQDVTLWNGLLAALTKNFMFSDALELFERLLNFPYLKPDSFTYPSVLKACGGLGRVGYGNLVHALVIKNGYLSDVVIASSIVSMYAKCGVFRFAIKLFDEITERDVACWNTVISCYYQDGQFEKALQLYEEMKGFGFQPDSFTLTTVISSSARLLDLEKGKQIHRELLHNGFVLDGFVSSALVDMYGKCGCLQAAIEVFEQISRKSVVAWNSMISGYSLKGDSKSCIELFRRMIWEGTKPTSTTLGSLLTACSRSASLHHGLFVHGYMVRNFIEPDIYVGSSLVDFYFKCGYVRSAENVFQIMPQANVISWNVMISGYVTFGSYHRAISMYHEMREAKISPDPVTLTSVLTACSQLAAIELGKEIHKCIIENKFQTDEVVMGALLDMYAKCGAVDEALKVFNQLPQRDLVSWTSMIAAYGSHGQAFEAIKLFERMQVSNVRPDRVTFLALLSACSHGGLVDEGRFYFHQMETHYGIQPTLELYSCLIDLLGRAGRLQEAYDILRNEPSIRYEPELLSTLFSACHLHGELQLGEEVVKELIESDGEDPSTYVILANLYASLKKWDLAKQVRLKIRDLKLRKTPGCSWIEIDKKIQMFLVEDKSHLHMESIYDCLAILLSHMVNIVNQFIYTYADTNRPHGDIFYYNQSGPLMPPLCYPFNNHLEDRECGQQEVSMENASLVWKSYICLAENNTCITTGRLTPVMYGQLATAVNVSYAIKHYTPLMLSLQNCNFVREAFLKITSSYCPALEHDLKVVNGGLGLISVGVMLCLVLWIPFAENPLMEDVFLQFSLKKVNGNNKGGRRDRKNGDNEINRPSPVASPLVGVV